MWGSLWPTSKRLCKQSLGFGTTVKIAYIFSVIYRRHLKRSSFRSFFFLIIMVIQVKDSDPAHRVTRSNTYIYISTSILTVNKGYVTAIKRLKWSRPVWLELHWGKKFFMGLEMDTNCLVTFTIVVNISPFPALPSTTDMVFTLLKDETTPSSVRVPDV